MAAVILVLFIIGSIFFVTMDRWWGLLGAIVRGDSSFLKEDIMESGICEEKRKDWAPQPPPFKPFWNMTPEERKADQKRRRVDWERQDARRRARQARQWAGVISQSPPKPAITYVRPQPRLQAFEPELNDLVREICDEIDAE